MCYSGCIHHSRSANHEPKSCHEAERHRPHLHGNWQGAALCGAENERYAEAGLIVMEKSPYAPAILISRDDIAKVVEAIKAEAK